MFEVLFFPVGAAIAAGWSISSSGRSGTAPSGFAGPWMRGLGITPEDIAEARVDMRAALGASALASLAQAGALVALFAMLGLPGIAGGDRRGALAASPSARCPW
jgi:hypothetical protein